MITKEVGNMKEAPQNILNLTKEDNDIIINHLYKWNKGVENYMKMAMDTYVDALEFRENDIIFHTTKIEPILDGDFGITKDNVNKTRGEIGDLVSISISQFGKPYDGILYAAVREIKLRSILTCN